MAAKLLFLVVLAVLCASCVISASAEIVRRLRGKQLEGERCTTPHVDRGVCTRQEDCDQAFLHSLPYDEHTEVCRQNANYKVLCCTSFMDFCKNRKVEHIYLGEDAVPGSFPRLARIGDDVNQWKCSANIISDQFLLTAAHCRSAKFAGLGCSTATDCDQIIPVKEFVSHPDYKRGSNYNDIALMQLEKVIQFKRKVLPICPAHNLAEDLETALTVAGWGSTEKLNVSPTLKFGQLRTVSHEECVQSYAPLIATLLKSKLRNGITGSMYCAQGEFDEKHGAHVDACTGDSGGPLQAETGKLPYLVGVISTGLGCGSDKPGIYTRVAVYFNWINTTMHNFMH